MFTAAAAFVERNFSVGESEECPIAARADIAARDKLVPRWRTMMLPAVTISPQTPSRPAAC
jgi:hypothetical protein